MKILKLQAENIKRISAVAIEPNGNMVEITGKNRQGKSSILDAITMAFEGADAIPQQPIRRGADKGQIVLNLGEPGDVDKQVIVTRKFRRTTDKEGVAKIATEVMVEAASGARFKSPQAMLDSFYGALSFDPYDFTKQKPHEQFDALRRFVPGVDFAALEGANLRDYEKRRELNRDAKAKRAEVAVIVVPEGTPAAEVDEAALVQQLAQAGEHNAQVQAAKIALTNDRERIETLRHNAAEARDGLADRIASIEQRREAHLAKIRADYESEIEGVKRAAEHVAGENETEAAELEQGLPAIEQRASQPTLDAEALQRQIAAARQTNLAVAQAARKSQLEREAKQLEAEAQALTDAMALREKQKADAIAAGTLPVPGLGFGKDDKGGPIITLNGLPFDQASDAEQLGVSIAIAMAENPKLRVIRVRDGNGMDSQAMEDLARLADKNNCQVWVETVRSDGRVAFVIEDGHLKSEADAAPAPEAKTANQDPPPLL